jgi:hypothetical protein
MDYGNIPHLLLVNSDGTHSAVFQQGDEFGSAHGIDVRTSRVHQGRLYGHSGIHAALPTSGTAYHLIDTTSLTAPSMHLRIDDISVQGTPFWFELYENAAVSSVGAPAAVKNLNRMYPDDNTVKVYDSPVVTSVGGVIGGVVLTSGAQGDLGDHEWVLEPGKHYLVKVWNRSLVAAYDYSLGLTWSEE